jgi:hypothetical protein
MKLLGKVKRDAQVLAFSALKAAGISKDAVDPDFLARDATLQTLVSGITPLRQQLDTFTTHIRSAATASDVIQSKFHSARPRTALFSI